MKATTGRRARTIAALVCAYAGTIAGAEARDGDAAHGPRGVGRMNLDLSSTEASVNFTRRLANSINIQVGDAIKTVSAGDRLTPAQAIAAYQVMRNNTQSLVLGADGNAIGGSADIGRAMQRHLNGMYIPENVTVVGDVARTGVVNFRGDFVNSGTYRAVSTDPRFDTATIIADNIVNNQGALLAAQNLDQSRNLNLELIALNDLVNAGTISAAGNLSMSAGGSLINALPPGITGSAPSVSASNSININAASVINNAMITSQLGNINISSRAAADAAAFNVLNVDNTGGVIQAANGAINVGDGSNTNIGMLGGDWLSDEMNVNAGAGEIAASVGKVSGVLHSSASIEHFNADTDVLVLGNNCVTGDPTFMNTGSIVVDGLVQVNEALAIIAGGNITGTNDAQIVNLSSAANYLIAGATIVSGSTSGGVIVNGSVGVASPVTIQFTNANGGNIDFSASIAPGAVITTIGGSLTMLAYSNSATTGNVWFSDQNPISTGLSNVPGGDITIFAGGAGGTIPETVRLGNLSTSGFVNAGDVTIKTAQPTIVGTSATFNPDGTTGGSFSSSATVTGDASVRVGSLEMIGTNHAIAGFPGSTGGNLLIQAGGSLVAGNVRTSGGNGEAGLSAGPGVGGNGGVGGNSGSITLTAESSISVDLIEARGGNGGAGGSGGTGGAGAVGGDGGLVVITGQSLIVSDINLDGGSGGNAALSATTNGSVGGAGGDGGSLEINIVDDLSLTSSVYARGGAGGNGSTSGASPRSGGAGGAGGTGGNIEVNGQNDLDWLGVLSQDGGAGGSGGSGTGGGASGPTGPAGLGGALQMVSASGDIGVLGFIQTDARLLSASAVDGDIQIQVFGDVTLTGINEAQSYRLDAATISFDSISAVPVAHEINLSGGSIILPSNELSAAASSGAGGSIILQASTLDWTGSATDALTLNANGTSAGGRVEVLLFSSDIQVGNGAGMVNVSATGDDGGSVSLNTNLNLVINDVESLNVAPLGANGDGGSVSLGGAVITKPTPGQIVIDQARGLGTGIGGSIDVSSAGPVSVGPNGLFLLDASGSTGGRVGVSTNDTLTLENGGINVTATGVNGDGGLISIGGTLVFGPEAIVLDASANPTGSGNGGRIVLNSRTTDAVFFGATGDLQLIANGGSSGSGGRLQIFSRGDLLFEEDGVSVRAGKKGGNGGTIEITAGSPTSDDRIFFNGDVDVSSKKGTGGRFLVFVSSPDPFVIGGATTNGIAGSLNLGKKNPGVVTLQSKGGVTVNQALTLVRNLNIFADGDVILNSSVGGKSTDIVNFGSADGGLIGGTSKAKITGDQVGIAVAKDVVGFDGAGLNVETVILNIEGEDVSLNSKTTIRLDGVSVSQSLSVTTKELITTQSAATVIAAPVLFLSAKKGVAIQTEVRVDADDLAIVSGGKGETKIQNVSGPIRLLDSSFAGLTLVSQGNVDVVGAIGSTKSNLNITVDGTLNSSTGSITAANFEFDAQGEVGTTLAPLVTNVARIEGVSGAGMTISSSAKTMTVGNLTTNGNIVFTAETITSSLNIEEGASILAENGAILFQNKNQNGFINVGSNASIETALAGGDVAFYVGDIIAPVAGTTPINVQITGSGGSAFFGANGITASAPNNVLNLKNADIIFSTGSASAKAITLGGGVEITADPPTRGGGASINYALLQPPHTVTGKASGSSPWTATPPASPAASTALRTMASASMFETHGDSLQVSNGFTMVSKNPDSATLTNSVDVNKIQISTATISGYLAATNEFALGEIDFEPGAFSTHVVADDELGIPVDASAAHITRKNNRRFTLHKGHVLVAPKLPITIETSFGEVSVDSGSVVLLMAKKNSVAIYNIDDCKRDSVKVSSGGRSLKLSPGRHAVLTSAQSERFDAVNPAECFAYRNLKLMQVGDNVKAFTGEFSVPLAINVVSQLKQMVNSKHHHAMRITDHLMKTTAVLLHMQGRAQYEQVVRPRIAAFNSSAEQLSVPPRH